MVSRQVKSAYIILGDNMTDKKEGNVVQEFILGNTNVKICDDYCNNCLDIDIEAILNRIAHRAQAQFSITETTT